MAKHIDVKILYKYVKANYRLYPQKESWYKAYKILLKGYFDKVDEINGFKILSPEKSLNYPRKPTWVPKPNVHFKTQQTVLQGHIAYAKNLDDQEILDTFGFFLIGLKDNEWIRSVYQPDGSKIKKRKKKTAKENLEELISNPKNLLKAKRLIKKKELLNKNRFR